MIQIINLRLALLLVIGMLHLSVPDGAAAQACAPGGGIPDPCLLPVATTDQTPDTDGYSAHNVPQLEAGQTYLDPRTGVLVYKLTSTTFPSDSNPNCVASNPNWTHDYSEGGYEVSLPYNGSTRAVLVRQNPESGGPWWLIDFTPGVGVSNARCLSGTGMQPFIDLAFTFSNNAATPYYAYVSDGTGVRPFDIRTLSEVPGDGWPGRRRRRDVAAPERERRLLRLDARGERIDRGRARAEHGHAEGLHELRRERAAHRSSGSVRGSLHE